MPHTERIGLRMQLSPGRRVACQTRRWRHMAGIMQTGPDGAPVSEPPALVLYMD